MEKALLILLSVSSFTRQYQTPLVGSNYNDTGKAYYVACVWKYHEEFLIDALLGGSWLGWPGFVL
jgi:hypothetical protein